MINIHRRIAALAISLATSFGAASVQAAPLAADFSSGQVFSSGIFNNIGWSFTVSSSIAVNGLGIFDEGADGLSGRHQVGLWDSSNNLLAQTTVFNGGSTMASASSLGQWLFQGIPTLALGPGSYKIGAFYSDGDPDTVIASAIGLTLDPALVFGASLASDGAAFGVPGAYGLVQPGVFGPNLRIAQVPEPGALALLALGLAGLAAARRRVRRPSAVS